MNAFIVDIFVHTSVECWQMLICTSKEKKEVIFEMFEDIVHLEGPKVEV